MFDPYHKWLAIPRDQRPPTYYQLLGVSPKETDAEVIEEAALRQSAHVRAYQIGPHAALSQRILNEISQARTVLLNPDKRKAYDESLAPAADSAAAAPGAPPPDLAVAVSAGAAVQKPATSTPAVAPRPVRAEPEWPAAESDTATIASVRRPSSAMPLLLMVGIGGGALAVVLIAGAAGLLWWLLGRGDDRQPVPVAAVADKAKAAVARDRPVAVAPPKPPPKFEPQPRPEPEPKPGPIVQPDPMPVPAELGPPRPPDYAVLANAIAAGQTGRCVIPKFEDPRAPFAFTERPPGWVLIGFRCGIGKFGNIDTVYALQAIYRDANGIRRGEEHGPFVDGGLDRLNRPIKTRVLRTETVQASDGYAVGGIRVRKGLNINGLGLIYMRVHGNRLDPQTAIDSPWVGDRTGGQEAWVNGNGALMVGINGAKEETHIYTVGLVTLGAQPAVALGEANPPARPIAPPMPAPMLPANQLLQAADAVIPIAVPHGWVNVLFTDAEHVRAGVLDGRYKNASDDLVLFDLRTRQQASATRITREFFAPCPHSLGPDGKYFSQTSSGTTLNVWAVGTGKRVVANWSLRAARPAPGGRPVDDNALLTHCLLADDRLLTVNANGALDIWKLPAMKWQRRIPGSVAQLESGMAHVSPDRRRCAIFTRFHFLIVNIATGKTVATDKVLPSKNVQHADTIMMAFNADGSRFVAAVGGDARKPALYCYDTASGKQLCRLTDLKLPNGSLDFHVVGWFGKEHFFLGQRTGELQLYRAPDGAAIARLRHAGGGMLITDAADGRLWYCTSANANSALIGVPFPAALRGPAPAQPYALTLAPEGLEGSVPAAAP